MSIAQMKKEINAKIDELSETQLKAVDEFIEKINLAKKKEWNLKMHLDDIMNERSEVLKRLAQ